MADNTKLEEIYRELKKHTSPKERAMSSIRFTEIADMMLTLSLRERLRLMPVFNDCADRVGWGMLPQAPHIVDVFARYRSLITWTKKVPVTV